MDLSWRFNEFVTCPHHITCETHDQCSIWSWVSDHGSPQLDLPTVNTLCYSTSAYLMAWTKQKAKKSTGSMASHKPLGGKAVAPAKSLSVMLCQRSKCGISGTKTQPSPTQYLLSGAELVLQAVQVCTFHSLPICLMNLWFQNQVWCSLCQNGAKHIVCDSCYNVTLLLPPISDLNNLYFLCTQCHKMKKQTLRHKEPYQVIFFRTWHAWCCTYFM